MCAGSVSKRYLSCFVIVLPLCCACVATLAVLFQGCTNTQGTAEAVRWDLIKAIERGDAGGETFDDYLAGRSAWLELELRRAEGIPTLLAICKHPDAGLRRGAILVIGRVGYNIQRYYPEDQRRLEKAIAMLRHMAAHDKDHEVRQFARKALPQALGDHDPWAWWAREHLGIPEDRWNRMTDAEKERALRAISIQGRQGLTRQENE